ncbi:HD domain-containing protein [Ureaplasma miroungigenitalium]|uniref:HD domain-containing protein n=1 Tax=Ureaplasma miroungigenitalium TaxID=1042321 RepID=UPI0021E7B3A8|nr:HD domain-containing protein [Ureaplasma miroungigenitalium]MCV3734483.1 HD domain-containing protein [Ureaplasma miroungigenitalium]
MRINDLNYINDPILGVITFEDDPWAMEIINSKEFWRLHKVKQLGTSHGGFYSASHTRFTHCVGVYFVVKKMLSKINFIESDTDNLEADKIVVKAAGLLHDIGHGPYSHSFEEALGNYNHEQVGLNIITNPNSEIYQILKKHNIDPHRVASVIDHTVDKKWMHQMISSQIDADRLDYLQRDSHYCGVKFGLLDYDLLFASMIVYQNEIAFHKGAWNVIENILISRYAMFENVYYKDISVTYDTLMQKTLKRVYDLYQKKQRFSNPQALQIFLPFLENKEWTYEDVMLLDDSSFLESFKSFANEDDDILRTLASNWLHNKEFITYETGLVNRVYPIDNSKKEYFYKSTEYYNKKIYDFSNPVRLYKYNNKNEIKISLLEDISIYISALKNEEKMKHKKYIFYRINPDGRDE